METAAAPVSLDRSSVRTRRLKDLESATNGIQTVVVQPAPPPKRVASNEYDTAFVVVFGVQKLLYGHHFR